MQLDIRYAVLSFCRDLTDPRAGSTPLAVVGVGSRVHDEAGNFWFFVVKSRPGDDPEMVDDTLSQEVLNNLPALLEKQLAEGAQEAGAAKFLSWLHDRFRNSLHVASFSEAQEAVSSLTELTSCLSHLYERNVSGQGPEQPLEIPSVNVTPFARVPALV